MSDGPAVPSSASYSGAEQGEGEGERQGGRQGQGEGQRGQRQVVEILAEEASAASASASAVASAALAAHSSSTSTTTTHNNTEPLSGEDQASEQLRQAQEGQEGQEGQEPLAKPRGRPLSYEEQIDGTHHRHRHHRHQPPSNAHANGPASLRRRRSPSTPAAAAEAEAEAIGTNRIDQHHPQTHHHPGTEGQRLQKSREGAAPSLLPSPQPPPPSSQSAIGDGSDGLATESVSESPRGQSYESDTRLPPPPPRFASSSWQRDLDSSGGAAPRPEPQHSNSSWQSSPQIATYSSLSQSRTLLPPPSGLYRRQPHVPGSPEQYSSSSQRANFTEGQALLNYASRPSTPRLQGPYQLETSFPRSGPRDSPFLPRQTSHGRSRESSDSLSLGRTFLPTYRQSRVSTSRSGMLDTGTSGRQHIDTPTSSIASLSPASQYLSSSRRDGSTDRCSSSATSHDHLILETGVGPSQPNPLRHRKMFSGDSGAYTASPDQEIGPPMSEYMGQSPSTFGYSAQRAVSGPGPLGRGDSASISDGSSQRKRKASSGDSPARGNSDGEKVHNRSTSDTVGKGHNSPGTVTGGDRQGSGAEASGSGGSGSGGKGVDTTGSKRIKTARACDSCRRKKIRCDVIEGGSPLGNPNNGNGGQICVHCKQYGFDCTFFLPITETRFKKKREREAEEAAAAQAAAMAAAAAAGHYPGAAVAMHPSLGGMPLGLGPPSVAAAPPLPSPQNTAYSNMGTPNGPPVRVSSTQEWPPKDPSRQYRPPWAHSDGSRSASKSATMMGKKGTGDRSISPSGSSSPQPPDSRVLGPTSIAYIVHSTAFVPGAAIEAHDIKHHQTFEVGASGDGIIKFHKPPKGPASSSGDEEESATVPEAIRGRLAGDVAEKLVNTYFEKVAVLFPVITKSEFLALSPPPPLLLYAICGVSALSREVPREVLGAVKVTLNAIFRANDIMSNSSTNRIRALLIMSLHSDLHGSTAVQSGTKCWNRTGVAIRMAQDLGLHRDASGKDDQDDDAFFLEQKRRIWGCCVTADRCASISLGHPLAIDLTDCDVRLPSPFEILKHPTDLPSDPSKGDRPFAFNTEMLKLSILFGRVMRTIYSPTGLMKATDAEITALLDDIDRWRGGLASELQFKGPDSDAHSGILHVAFACLQMLFWRVFMRISYMCPAHLTFSLTIERMTALIRFSSESIEWVDRNDFYLDAFQIVSYSLVFCATVQFHAWVRRGDPEAFNALKLARDCVARSNRDSKKEDLTLRAKIAEVITLLFEAASGVYAHTPSSGTLNPTAGVTNRRTTETLHGLVFRPDATRPGGGVYVATDKSLVLRDLPKGTVILQESEAGRVPALIRTSMEPNGQGWQPVVNNQLMKPEASQVVGDLTAVGGGVWTDAEGRPVSRRGSKLVTMVPLATGQLDYLGQDAALRSATQMAGGSGVNFNPHLNDPLWPPADHVFESPAHLAPNLFDPNQGADPIMLDGLPGMNGSAFSWDDWSSFFARVNPVSGQQLQFDINGPPSSTAAVMMGISSAFDLGNTESASIGASTHHA